MLGLIFTQNAGESFRTYTSFNHLGQEPSFHTLACFLYFQKLSQVNSPCPCRWWLQFLRGVPHPQHHCCAEWGFDIPDRRRIFPKHVLVGIWVSSECWDIDALLFNYMGEYGCTADMIHSQAPLSGSVPLYPCQQSPPEIGEHLTALPNKIAGSPLGGSLFAAASQPDTVSSWSPGSSPVQRKNTTTPSIQPAVSHSTSSRSSCIAFFFLN